MSAIFKKEFKSAFCSLIAPLFIGVVICVIGGFTVFDQFAEGEPQFEYTLIKAAFWSLLITAILTMRTLSEERRAKTDQLLYYLPITSTQIVTGKFFAMVCVFAFPCIVFCFYPLLMEGYVENGEVNFILTYATILGYFLLGCTVIALSMFISSLTENQILCAILSLFTFAALYFLGMYADSLPDDAWIGFALVTVLCLVAALIIYIATKNYTVAAVAAVVLVGAACAVYVIDSGLYTGLFPKILSAVCIFRPLENIATVVNLKEIFDWSPYVYYLSTTALFVFLTVQSFEKRRWN